MNTLSAYLTYALYERQSRAFHYFCVLRSDRVVIDVDGQYPGHKLEILTAIGSKGSGNVRRQLDKERRDRGKIRKLENRRVAILSTWFPPYCCYQKSKTKRMTRLSALE
jgi:hypothetical protein